MITFPVGRMVLLQLTTAFSNHSDRQVPTKTPRDYFLPEFDYVLDEKLCNVLCTPSEVENIHKSPGPDKLLPRILQECTLELSTSLCNLFNKSFQSGSLPSDWKIAYIIPVHKKGPNTKRKTIAKSRYKHPSFAKQWRRLEHQELSHSGLNINY